MISQFRKTRIFSEFMSEYLVFMLSVSLDTGGSPCRRRIFNPRLDGPTSRTVKIMHSSYRSIKIQINGSRYDLYI